MGDLTAKQKAENFKLRMEGLNLVLTPIANSPALSAVVALYLGAALAYTTQKMGIEQPATRPEDILEFLAKSGALGIPTGLITNLPSVGGV